MFGMGPGELIMIATFWLVVATVVGVVLRFAFRPITDRLDRIIRLLEQSNGR